MQITRIARVAAREHVPNRRFTQGRAQLVKRRNEFMQAVIIKRHVNSNRNVARLWFRTLMNGNETTTKMILKGGMWSNDRAANVALRLLFNLFFFRFAIIIKTLQPSSQSSSVAINLSLRSDDIDLVRWFIERWTFRDSSKAIID